MLLVATFLAAASMGPLLIQIILIVGVLALAWYGLEALGLPAPAVRIGQILLTLVAIIWAIYVLMGAFGGGGGEIKL